MHIVLAMFVCVAIAGASGAVKVEKFQVKTDKAAVARNAKAEYKVNP